MLIRMTRRLSQVDRRTRRIEKTRREIKHAAAKLFFEKGFRAVTMADIGEAVGLAPGSLYYYFQNKEDILKEIDAECLQKAKELLDNLSPGTKTLRETVQGLFMAVYSFARQHKEYFLFLTRMVSSVDPALLSHITKGRFQVYATARKRLAQLMAHFQERGLAREDVAPEDLAQFLLGLIHSLMLAWFLGLTKEVDMPKTLDTMTELFMAGARRKEA